MLERLQNIVERVDRSMVKFADMRVYQSTQLTLTTRKGMTEKVSSEKLDGIGIRALVNGAWGFASVASFENTDVTSALEAAIKMARGTSDSVKNKVLVDTEPSFEARNC